MEYKHISTIYALLLNRLVIFTASGSMESTEFILSDEFFMHAALKEAKLAWEEDEIPIGAVIVCKQTIIAKGHNMTEQLNDVTAHAEMLAFTAAAGYLNSKYLTDCVLYVTLEP